MSPQWADEMSVHIFAVPALENFYLSASLMFGDPRDLNWERHNAKAFHRSYNVFQNSGLGSGHMYSGAEVLMQYVDWYEKNSPPVDNPKRKRT